MPAPQLTNTVPAHAFVRDDMWLQTDAPNYNGSGGSAAVAVIDFDTGVAAGETITVEWGATVLVFEAAASPDDSSLQFTASGSNAIAASNFTNALRTNAIVSRWYTVTRVGTVVTLTARVGGAAYSLTITADPVTIFTGVAYTLGTDNAPAPNYHMALRVWTNITAPTEVAGVPLNGAVRFNISSMLNIPSLCTGTWPAITLANAVPTDFQRVLWWAEVFEVFGEPPTEHQMLRIGHSESWRTAWWATMRREEWQHTQTFIDEAMGVGTKQRQFWTWRGRQAKRFTSTTEKHVLGWYWWDGAATVYTELKMAVRVFMKSGLSVNWTERYTCADPLVAPGEISLWATGYEALDIAALVPAGDACARYEVRIVNTEQEVSETFTFHMADDDFNELQVQFFNSLGICETMRCTGQWTMGAEAEHDVLQQVLGMDAVAGQSARIQQPLGTNEILEFSTGFVKRWELYALADILHSRAVRWYDAERDRIYNLVLDKPSTRIVARGTDDEHLYALNLRAFIGDPVTAYSLPKTIVT